MSRKTLTKLFGGENQSTKVTKVRNKKKSESKPVTAAETKDNEHVDVEDDDSLSSFEVKLSRNGSSTEGCFNINTPKLAVQEREANTTHQTDEGQELVGVGHSKDSSFGDDQTSQSEEEELLHEIVNEETEVKQDHTCKITVSVVISTPVTPEPQMLLDSPVPHTDKPQVLSDPPVINKDQPELDNQGTLSIPTTPEQETLEPSLDQPIALREPKRQTKGMSLTGSTTKPLPPSPNTQESGVHVKCSYVHMSYVPYLGESKC